ncbi:MAG: CinA family nicotinamide mononucleotide deamidase-related protein [Bacteroidales bacterium]|nr:CinA family nicotinamide mononucleotide deamidase-related protein [Bacteroidales bacterium]
MTQASICTIGDEILIGQIVDTNSSHISQALNSLGIKVTRMLSIGDDHDVIVNSLGLELTKNDIVIVTGGLGPTKDDITKAALAHLSGTIVYKTDERQLEIIHKILSSRGLDVLDINLAQASVPETCDVIPNRCGTAPIMVFRFPADRFGHEATLYSLPGVPYEALAALPDILEDIKAHNSLSDIYHRTVMTYGIAESALAKMIEEWEDNLPSDMHLAYLPNPLTGVRLRLSIYGGNKEDEEARIEAELARLRPILGSFLYSDHDDTLENCVGRMLYEAGKTVSVAESCTGGTISALFTSVPGASEYYLGSVTSYANEIKINVLGVPAEIIAEHGAVSSECVAAMAEGVRRLTGSDYSVATSGIAGPGGGSADKPVGLVWIGVSSDKGTETFSMVFRNDRKRNIERFASSALNILREKLVNELKY